mgnify:CR=1 FL=1
MWKDRARDTRACGGGWKDGERFRRRARVERKSNALLASRDASANGNRVSPRFAARRLRAPSAPRYFGSAADFGDLFAIVNSSKALLDATLPAEPDPYEVRESIERCMPAGPVEATTWSTA